MITQSQDTSPETEEVLVSLIRNSSISERISRVRSLSRSTIMLSRRAIMRANPALNDNEVNYLFVAYQYGKKIAGLLREYMRARAL